MATYDNGPGSYLWNDFMGLDTDWHRGKVEAEIGSEPTVYLDDSSYTFSGNNLGSASYYIWATKAYNTNGADEWSELDWIFLRNHVSFESSHGSWGSEEIAKAVSVTIFDSDEVKLKTVWRKYDVSNNLDIEEIYIGNSTERTYYSQYTYDNWGNIIVSEDALGHKTFFSFTNTDSEDEFEVGTSFSDSFYSNTVNSNIHGLLAGVAQYQNSSETVKQESYFNYDSVGNLLQTKVLHDGAWIYTNSTYDQYGNLITTTDALGRTTYLTYSATYSGAYLSESTIIVGGQNISTFYKYEFATGLLLNTTQTGEGTTSETDFTSQSVSSLNAGYLQINSGTQVYLHGTYGTNVTSLLPEITVNEGSNWFFDDDIYLDNDLRRSGSETNITNAESTTDWSTESSSVYLDSAVFDEGSGSILLDTDSTGNYGDANYDPSGTWDWSGIEFVVFSLRINSTSNLNNDGISLNIKDSANKYRVYKNLENSCVDGVDSWYICVVPFNDYDSEDAGFDDTLVTLLKWRVQGTSHPYGLNIDEVFVDVGQWVFIEMFVPDDLAGTAFGDFTARLSFWDGVFYDGDYPLSLRGNDDGVMESTSTANSPELLDGTSFFDVYGSYDGGSAYGQGDRGGTISPSGTYNDNSAGNMTFSSLWQSVNKSIGFAIKLPPDDGQDSSTDGISQVRIRIEVWYNNPGTTSLEGFGRTTLFEHDVLGRRTKISLPKVNGVITNKTITYYDTNSTVFITELNGNTTRQYFDELGRLYKTAWYNGSVLYSNSSQTFDWRNSIETSITVMENTFTNDFDSLGRIINSTRPDNTFSTITYSDSNQTRVFTDAKGNKTLAQYDFLGKLILYRSYLNSTSYYETTYSYDAVGNLIQTVDPKNQTITHTFDDLNRLTRTDFPDGSYILKSYNDVGQVISAVDRNGNNVNYTYNDIGLLTKLTYPNSTYTEYNYNSYGERTFMNSTESTYYYSYDNLGRLTNQTQVTDGSTFTSLYTYDSVGRLVTVTYPDGTQVTNSYDFLNRLTQVGSYANFTYFKDGRIETIKYGNNVNTSYTYNVLRRVQRILVLRPNGTEFLDLNHTYDKVGNILSINSETYSYDTLNRLISSTGPWGTILYTYDEVGNRLTKTEGETTINYTIGSYNRLISSDSPQTYYYYDSDGNMISKNDPSTSWNYTFAWGDQLTKVEVNSSMVAEYFYDGDGGRIKTVENNVTVLFATGFEKITSNNTLVKSISGNGLIARVINGTVKYYHANHVGSIRLVTNSSGNSLFDSNYEPFGSKVNQTGNDPFKFFGLREDSLTGLYRIGPDYYDPEIGRYISNNYYLKANNPLGEESHSNPLNIDMTTSYDKHVSNNQWIRQASAISYTQPSINTGVIKSPTTAPVTPIIINKDPLLLAYEQFAKTQYNEVGNILGTYYSGDVVVEWNSGNCRAVTNGCYNSDEDIIFLNREKFGSGDSYEDAQGTLVHELTHLILSKKGKWTLHDDNRWLHDSVAAYVRETLGFGRLDPDFVYAVDIYAFSPITHPLTVGPEFLRWAMDNHLTSFFPDNYIWSIVWQQANYDSVRDFIYKDVDAYCSDWFRCTWDDTVGIP